MNLMAPKVGNILIGVWMVVLGLICVPVPRLKGAVGLKRKWVVVPWFRGVVRSRLVLSLFRIYWLLCG